MARAIGCGLSTGLLRAEPTAAAMVSPARPPAAWFPARTCRLAVVCLAASSTTSSSRKPRGIMLPQPISPELQEFLGVPEISRAQAIKLIWAYIKENNLQDPNNKKIIVCDEKLKKVFGKERVGMLEVSGLISPHLLKPQN